MSETTKKETDPLEEEQTIAVSVKLGKTHHEALRRWSKARFGLANHASMVRMLIHEAWKQEQANGAAVTSER